MNWKANRDSSVQRGIISLFISRTGRRKCSAIAATGDIFISPSDFEGYGIALLEAMSLGLAPIIHKLPLGVYSDLPEGVGFSLDTTDAKAYAESILRLDADRELLARMSRKARALVAEKYDISRTAVSYMEYFRERQAAGVDKGPGPGKKENFGMLDRPYIPNKLAYIIKKHRG